MVTIFCNFFVHYTYCTFSTVKPLTIKLLEITTTEAKDFSLLYKVGIKLNLNSLKALRFIVSRFIDKSISACNELRVTFPPFSYDEIKKN